MHPNEKKALEAVRRLFDEDQLQKKTSTDLAKDNFTVDKVHAIFAAICVDYLSSESFRSDNDYMNKSIAMGKILHLLERLKG